MLGFNFKRSHTEGGGNTAALTLCLASGQGNSGCPRGTSCWDLRSQPTPTPKLWWENLRVLTDGGTVEEADSRTRARNIAQLQVGIWVRPPRLTLLCLWARCSPSLVTSVKQKD